MGTTAQAFADFLEKLTPTDYHMNTMVPARKKSVEDKLSENFPPTHDMPFSEAYLIGSAAKKTALRPVEDTDLIAIFSNENDAYSTYRYDSQKFLYKIRNAYQGTQIQQVGARGQAVRVFYETGGYVDIAPVFDAGNGDYLLPAGDGSWIYTSPFKANAWFRDRNAELSYNLPPLVRLLKKWNKAHSKRLTSFHLETVVASCFSKLSSNHRSNLADFFRWAANHLDVQDPGGHSGYLSSYLGWSSRDEVTRSFSTALTRAELALEKESEGDHTEAKRQWGIILGEGFPS
ncbi:hypothetical protein SUDANB95_06343 [Actinosynnema sp. ALI-1.44]